MIAQVPLLLAGFSSSFVIGLIVVLAALGLWWFKQRQQNSGSRWFHMNPSANVTPEQYRKLLVGGIYIEQQDAYQNSLTTGLDKTRIETITKEWWGVNNAQDAIRTMEYLRSEGFFRYFPVVFEAFMADDDERKKEIIIDRMAPEGTVTKKKKDEIMEEMQKVYSRQQHLTETYDELKEDGIIDSREDIQRLGVLGWDCGRVNFLARLCYDAGYLTEKQAWDYVDYAYQLSKISFVSWEDFAKSYVIGRAIWGGKEGENRDIVAIARELLDDPDSPWKQVAW